VHNEVISIIAGKVVDPVSKRVYTTGMIEKALAELSALHGHQHDGHKKEKAEKTDKTEKTEKPKEEEEANVEDKTKGKEKDLPSWSGVVTTRSSKSQALDAIKALVAHQPIPIARARMKVRVSCALALLKQNVKANYAKKEVSENGSTEKGSKSTVKDSILALIEEVLDQDTAGDEWEVTGYVEPGSFKILGELIGEETRGKGRIEVLDTAVIHEGDERG
jgi:ribosome maturation protein SDO1